MKSYQLLFTLFSLLSLYPSHGQSVNAAPQQQRRAEQNETDSRLAQWAKLPPPSVAEMQPFLGIWEEHRKNDGQLSNATTFEVRDNTVRARCRVLPPRGEPFQMEVQFVRVLDGQTLQWGLRNPSMGIILHTAKLADANTLHGTSEPVGISHAPPPKNFTLKRRLGDTPAASPKNRSDAVLTPREAERDRKRDEWQRPAEIMAALAVKPGHRVADIGCGTGYFTFRLAAQVGVEGKVYAVDIDEVAINKVEARKERDRLPQVEPILAESANPHLPNNLDAVLIVDTYHEFREYDQTMQAVWRSLKAGGRLVIIDGAGPADRPRTEYHRLHTIPADLVRTEVTRQGFVFKESKPGFYDAEYGKQMYFLIFEKPE